MAGPAFTTYSFKDTSGSITHPLLPPFAFAGQIGLNRATVMMATEKTVHDIAADGTVVVSAIVGDNGRLELEIQQTSSLHKYLLGWLNLVKTAMLAGDVTNWATMAVTLRNIVDGSVHVLSGVSPSKMPDKPYVAQAQHVVWSLWAADIQNI